jgi:Fe-S cluster assembly iron-binding protein IscA
MHIKIITKGMDEMDITDKASDVIKALLKKNNTSGIRVYFVGPSWGGLKFDMSLEEAKENEVVREVNGIQVALDPSFNNYTKKLVIDYSPNFDELFIKGSGNC